VKFVNVQTEDIISYPFSIFFNRDSYQLMSRRDLVNLREIANVAKANGYKLRLRGSCDSATATPAYNQTLSENRCRKIMHELMEMGIPENQIILVPVGGVKELDPTEYDRRVLIELIKEAPKE
jgi:outer membrane protein OmpA-like peptidoglycan-associated protein